MAGVSAPARSLSVTAAAAAGSSSTFGARMPLAASPFHRGFASIRQAATALSRRELLGSGAAAAALGPPLAAQAAVPGSSSMTMAATAAAAPVANNVQMGELTTELDSFGVERLALQPEGWNSWSWRGEKVNWLKSGDSGPKVLLIHGFGASAYHFRYNVPELAKHCQVYAIDCLGFGWSSKPVVEYNGYKLWSDQISDFMREVVGGDEKVVLVGNSLGGYNALATAARYPELVRGVVLLNAAGRFDEPGVIEEAQAPVKSLWARLVGQVSASLKRSTVYASFVFAKQPARIRQVLNQVYVAPGHVDEDLVRSISLPAQDRNAPEVFYRIITAQGEPMNRLLDKLDNMPLYLLWGSKDPWCVPARATQIERYYPKAERTDLISGHCPHDDHPDLVNTNLIRWLKKLDAPATA